MKKISCLFLALVMIFSVTCTTAMAATPRYGNKPSNYNDCIGGGSGHFTGTSNTFYITTTKYAASTYFEFGVDDANNRNSIWTFSVYKNNNLICSALVQGDYIFDYEPVNNLSAGTYTVVVSAPGGAAIDGTSKNATVLVWAP